jgi:rubrerythrin
MDTTTVTKKTAAARQLFRRELAEAGRDFSAFDDVLNFAIEDKTLAGDFYANLAAKAATPWTRKMFEDLARGKAEQLRALEEVKQRGYLRPRPEKVQNLKLTDYVTAEVLPRKEMEPREALIYAIRVERDTLRLYVNLADNAGERQIQNLFLAIAQDQAEHLRRLEVEYEEHFLAEN